MKKIILFVFIASVMSCSQVIGGPDKSTGHGGHVIITTDGPHHGEKPGTPKGGKRNE